jgi:hypothetical protein
MESVTEYRTTSRSSRTARPSVAIAFTGRMPMDARAFGSCAIAAADAGVLDSCGTIGTAGAGNSRALVVTTAPVLTRDNIAAEGSDNGDNPSSRPDIGSGRDRLVG